MINVTLFYALIIGGALLISIAALFTIKKLTRENLKKFQTFSGIYFVIAILLGGLTYIYIDLLAKRMLIVTDSNGQYEYNFVFTPQTLHLNNGASLTITPDEIERILILNNSEQDVFYEYVNYGNFHMDTTPKVIASYQHLNNIARIDHIFEDPPDSVRVDRNSRGDLRAWLHY